MPASLGALAESTQRLDACSIKSQQQQGTSAVTLEVYLQASYK